MSELASAALAQRPQSKPGTSYEYSNVGYVIAGAMAEKVTGESWEKLMKREVFEPLEMKSAGFGPAGYEHPWGHTAGNQPITPDWNQWRSAPDPKTVPDNPPSIGPAGTVHSSLGDWAKFIDAQMKRPEGFLSPDSWKHLQTPIPGFQYTPGGWNTLNDKSGELWHNGSNTMFQSLVRLQPGTKSRSSRAVLVATNRFADGGDVASFKLAKNLLS